MGEHVISGVVTHPDGQPAAGAEVTLVPDHQPIGLTGQRALGLMQDGSGGWRWSLDFVATRCTAATAKTDEHGRFSLAVDGRLAEEAARVRLALRAEMGPLVSRRTLLRVDTSVGPQQLSLGPSCLPVVSLVDPDGSPIVGADAELSLSVENEVGDSIPEWHDILGGRSDGEGRVVFPRVPAHPDWSAWLVVNAPGRPRLRESAIEAKAFFDQTARVVVPVGVEVRGRIQRPTAGSRGPLLVWSFRRGEDPLPNHGHQVFAGADGSFALVDVPSSGASVVMEELPEPGPPEVAENQRREMARKVINLDGPVDLGVVVLPPPLSITGRVQLADGRPPASGWMSTAPPAQASFPIRKDGTFRVAGLEPGTHRLTFWVMEAEAAEGHPFRDTIETEGEFEAGAMDVLVRVQGGGNLIVRFHPKGRPAEPLEVSSPSLAWGHCGGGPSGKAAEIRMSFEPGIRTDLRVEAEGYRTHLLGPVEIRPDRPTIVEVELEPE